jgi:hypothetical protein
MGRERRDEAICELAPERVFEAGERRRPGRLFLVRVAERADVGQES